MKRIRVRVLMIMIVAVFFFMQNLQTVCALSEDPVQKLVSDFQKETRCKSISVVVYDQGEISYYGDSDCLYQIGSMTKAFTGLAIQKLIYTGQISLEDNISNYIPGFEAFYEKNTVNITIRDLLEQKSGYTNSEKEYPSATKDMTLSDWVQSISGKELKFLPGTEYAYSNVNYNLLGYIIEQASGLSYLEYMEKEVLIPLKLNNTYVIRPEGGNVEEGTRLGCRMTFAFPISVREASIPAGYFYSNANDMGRWIEIFTGNADIPKELEIPIEMIKESIVDVHDYYSGWECFEDNVIGHSGGTPNYSSRICFSDSENVGVCVLTNLNVAASTDSLCNMIFNLKLNREIDRLSCDVWTIFDTVFTWISVVCIFISGVVILKRSRKINILLLVSLVILLILLVVLLPMIFAADLMSILLTWAPWSLLGGMILMIINILMIAVNLVIGKKNENYFKAGRKSAVDGNS